MKMQEKKKLYRLRYWILGLIVALLYFQVEYISVLADNEKIIASTTDESNIYLYMKNTSEITGGTVQIGNKICEGISIAGMDAFSTPMRTVILVDNSQSIKADKRSDIQNILTQLVDQSIQGEEYRVGVFSNTVTWLSDYSSDYESMKSIIDGIQYENQNTYFSDCLYGILEEMTQNADATYSRIIMVSDGADDNSIGYTINEVSVLAEKSNIPLYMIGTPGDNKALENMFSFARSSKADYYLLDGSISNEDVVAGLLSDHELVCLRVTPDVSLLDGSQKSIQVILDTQSGEVKMTAAVNMPFGRVDDSTETPESTEMPESTETPEATVQPSLPSLGGGNKDATEDDGKDAGQGKGLLLILIIGLVVVLAAVAGVIIFIIVSKKKKTTTPTDNSSGQAETPPSPVDSNPLDQEDKTQLIYGGDSDGGEMTRMLLGQPTQSVWLALKSVERPDKEFRVPMKDVILIGRKNADIVIDFDQHISSKHCEIIKRGELLYIRDLGSLNGTYYENVRVLEQEIPIVDGGTIKLGNSKFIVTIIKQ